jgi:hypothetical protein
VPEQVMNPQTLETQEILTIEEQASNLLQQTERQSHLYAIAQRLQNILQLELIRRGLFARQIAQLRSTKPAFK